MLLHKRMDVRGAELYDAYNLVLTDHGQMGIATVTHHASLTASAVAVHPLFYLRMKREEQHVINPLDTDP